MGRVRLDQRTVELSDRLCECGCGLRTFVSPKTRADRGWVKGEPRRFRKNHQGTRAGVPALARRRFSGPVRLCACGCGLGASTIHSRYHRGHQRRAGEPYLVDENGCWVWQWSVASHGYPRLRLDGRQQRAHRVFYERHVGPIPEGCDVHHECGVRRCVNPAHLRALPRDEHNLIHHGDASR